MPSSQEQLQAKRVELILQQLEQLPTLPAVAVRVLEAAVDVDGSSKEIVDLISSDASLTTRILQLVHRADTGVRSDVTSVERAVVLLGFEAIRSAVLALAAFETFGGKSAGGQFSRAEFWKHSVSVACCAELLAEAVSQIPGSSGAISTADAFTCGLLHDIGKVAMDTVLPKSFARVVEAADMLRGNIADLERTVIGLDHMVVGKRLAERWNLPTQLRETIWLHGQLPQSLPATVKHGRLINIVTLADLLVREQHLGYSGNYTFNISRDGLIEAVGLTGEAVEAAMQKLVSQIEARAKSLQLDQVSSQELYQQALSRANQELGKITGQLAAKNKKLAVRAKFFDVLSAFQSGLKADSSPQIVLQAIGQTGVSVLDVTSVAAFSLMPSQDFAEVLLFDASGEMFESSLVDCDQRPSAPVSGDGPVLHAGDELNWLLLAISPRLAGDQRYWICLEAEGNCVGGVVWGAATGESQRLAPQVRELSAIAGGWGLALRTAQIREESKILAEQLAEANRKLQSAQTELVRSRMMTSVGEMAAGGAHEMNNPLAVISGRSQLLATTLSDPKQKAMAHLIHEQSHRLSEIISELMDFAKPVPPKIVECDPAELVDRALHSVKEHSEIADRSIEVTMGDVPTVLVDPMQVSAALAEVLENAILATDPARGQVTVHGAFDAHSSRVAITILDNGHGMDQETLRRAFDPFFSNKPAGRRRGMGLAKALRWVECSGGSIRLESRIGQGTRTLVLLPAVASAVSAVKPAGRKAAT